MSFSTIANYDYTHGAGIAPNRRIQFLGDGKHVKGVVKAKTMGKFKKTGELSEENMRIEGVSTKEMMKIMKAARNSNSDPEYPADRSFTTIPYTEKVNIIKSLSPEGPYQITKFNDVETNPYYEVVKRIIFYDQR